MATKDKSIFIKNVYYMLAYAFRALKMDEYDDLAGEDFEHMHDLFAAILAKGITRQVKQGLYREYLDRTEDLTTVRGKIDLQGTLRNRIAKSQRISCEYDELSENNLNNKVRTFPGVFVAGFAGVTPKVPFSSVSGADVAPTVKF